MTGLGLWGILGEHETRRVVSSNSEGLIEELLLEFGYSLGASLLVIEGDDLFEPGSVAATRSIIRALEDIPWVENVLSFEEVPRVGSLPIPVPLMPPTDAEPQAFAAARQLALEHPLVAGQMLAKDARTWVFPVIIDSARFEEGLDGETLVEPAPALRAAVRGVDLPADMRARLTGSLMMAHDSEVTFLREQWLFHGIAYVLVFLLASFMFRGFTAVVLAGGGPVIGVVWTFGIVKLLGMTMSSLTLILLPIMIMMIGFTDSVHIMVHIRRERGRGLSPLEATRTSLRVMILPCFLTTLTTGLGFASLLLARSDLVREFGIACTVGVVSTFLAVMCFLPFFASSRFGHYLRERESHSLVEGTLPWTKKGWAWISRHSKLITAFGLLLTAGTIVHGLGVETENRVAADIPRSSESARALNHIESAMGGSVPLKVIVSWDESRQSDEDAIIGAVAAAHASFTMEKQHSEPFSLMNLIDFFGKSNRPEDFELATLELLPQNLRESVFDSELRAAPINALIPDRGYRHFEPVFERIETRLDALATQHPGFHFDLAGQAVLSGRLFGQFTEDLMESLAYAALTIFLVLTFAFRSLRLGLISVIPNAFPLSVTASMLVLLDMPMAGATAFVMSLGIAVDDTIHFMTRFRFEFDKDDDIDAAIERTILRVGKALLMTTTVLVVGFASVLTSDFPRNRVFSAMVVFTIASALACDMVLLPAMLKSFLGARWRPKRRAS